MINKVLISCIILMFVLGIANTFIPSKIASTALDILDDSIIFIFGYFLCLKHNEK